jgi:LmbE family N-acetylglucosaminyl deacetylase
MKKILLYTFFCSLIFSQTLKPKTAAEIRLDLDKLNVLGSVLYIAAHPDDENTAAISYYAKGKHFRSAYLSMTRGDGGQNLIGTEKGVLMGMIRTQELLQARSVDGGEQFFTRAIDFGYSKSPEETMKIWNKNEILSDVVWLIRKFRPDVIITRFSPSGIGTHGHHTASAVLAVEAFHAAGDPKKFSDQLKYVKVWQAKRIVWDSWRFGRGSGPEANPGSAINENIGAYNHILGQSYTEISAISRTKHKSQGFGSQGKRGDQYSYYEHLAGDPAEKSLFDGITTSWNRVTSDPKIPNQINKVIKSFNITKPYDSVDDLIILQKLISNLPNSIYKDEKLSDIREIIVSSLGLWFEAISDSYIVSKGDVLDFKLTAINRSSLNVLLKSVQLPFNNKLVAINKKLSSNENLTENFKIQLPNNAKISQPYWLEKEPNFGNFVIDKQELIGLAEAKSSLLVKAVFEIQGEIYELETAILNRRVDRVDGELYRAVEIRPAVMIQVEEPLLLFADQNKKTIRIKLKSSKNNVKGILKLQHPENWTTEPKSVAFDLKNKDDEHFVEFSISPPKAGSEASLKVIAEVDGQDYSHGYLDIYYPHIGHHPYFPESIINLRKIDTKKVINNIGYIMGSGDNIPDVLRILGYNVQLLSDEELEQSDLSKFETIIAGVRAYNTRERLKYSQNRLMEYVKNGGHYIVQYNVSFGLQVEDIGPYPFTISRDRITDETAKLNILDSKHSVFNFPNKIEQSDFSSWVQERGLYFANPWNEKYETLLAGNDEGESLKKGALLYTKYGKGSFVYTGLSMFRELPAGVTGAIRLFVNIISMGAKND